jgi:hypothetical protein
MKNLSHKRKRPQEEAHKEDYNEMKQNLKELNEDIEFLKKEIKSLKQSNEEKDELIKIILQKNTKIEESIIIIVDKAMFGFLFMVLLKYFKNKKCFLNIQENINLKKDNNLLRKTIKELKDKNHILEKELAKIYPVALSFQLRKLLKKIFEFIVNDRYLSSGLKKIGREVYFIMPNEYYSSYFSRHDIIQAFIFLLQIIQSYLLDCDNKIHYVDKNAIFQDSLRKRINIFNNYSEFFRFFNIDKKYEEILIKYIPPYIFYSIDNYTFEEKMSSLISKIK